MIAIPNMEKPKNAFNCSVKINPEERRCIYTGKVFEETLSLLIDRPCDDCPLIEIAEPTETIIHDIRKLIAFIEPRMIIASTYAEQIERAEAVKNWLLSIVGERRAE